MNITTQRPIFLFSAGWRSGSTLLQRMITSSGESLIWGESGSALNHLSNSWQGYSQMLGDGGQLFKYGYGGHGLEQYQTFKSSGQEGVNKWIASMNVEHEIFLEAYRSFFYNIYAMPARDLGYERWGIKEVQSGIETADFMKLVFPEAKFVFLVRNPLDCLLSIKRRNWLDEKNSTQALERYSKHWNHLAREFREAEYGFLITYEKLLNEPEELQNLRNYLGLKNLEYEFSKNSRADWKATNNNVLSYFEKRRILKNVSTEMKLYGYE